jgi:enoyl-CoA hydratase/carnithine racemase
VGGGFGLACAADFRVASARSRFHANFSALGFHHGFGLSATLPRIVGPQRALELPVTSCRLSGEQAFAMGLVDRLAADGAERGEALAFAAEIAALAPLAVRSIKQTMRGGLAGDVRAALGRELQEQQRLWRTEDSEIGIAASLERVMPQFIGE